MPDLQRTDNRQQNTINAINAIQTTLCFTNKPYLNSNGKMVIVVECKVVCIPLDKNGLHAYNHDQII